VGGLESKINKIFHSFFASFHAILQSIQLLGGPNKVLALCVPLVTSIGFLSQQQEDGHEEARANANLWVLFLGFRGEDW